MVNLLVVFKSISLSRKMRGFCQLDLLLKSVCVCARAYVCACVRACEIVCMHTCLCIHA